MGRMEGKQGCRGLRYEAGVLRFSVAMRATEEFKKGSDMVSTGQRADCSKALCRIVENLGKRHQGLDQGSGRGWRREEGLLRHGKTLIRYESKKGRSLPHREMAQKKPP